MTADVIRDAKKSPFVTFDIVLVDGTTYTITGPDFIAIAPFPRPREIILYSADSENPNGYRTRTINLGLVLEVVSPSAAGTTPSNNGR